MTLIKAKKLKAFKKGMRSIGTPEPVYVYPWFDLDTYDITSVTIDGEVDVEKLKSLVRIIEEVNKL